MTEIPNPLKDEMEKYGIIMANMALDSSVIECRLAVTNAKGFLADAQEILDTAELVHREQLQECKNKIRDLVLERGASAAHQGVKATYRKAHTSETYPVAEVRKILLGNPAILPTFKAIADIKTFAATVSISYKVPLEEMLPGG